MLIPVTFDPAIGRQFIKYAHLVAGRGYVHNTLGNMVMRAPHPDFPHGLAYTKHAEISLEEMELENIVITDVPTSRIVWGERMTSVGHNLSREILRLRPEHQPERHRKIPQLEAPRQEIALAEENDIAVRRIDLHAAQGRSRQRLVEPDAAEGLLTARVRRGLEIDTGALLGRVGQT